MTGSDEATQVVDPDDNGEFNLSAQVDLEFKLDAESVADAAASEFGDVISQARSQIDDDRRQATKVYDEKKKKVSELTDQLVDKFRKEKKDKRLTAADELCAALNKAHKLTDEKNHEVKITGPSDSKEPNCDIDSQKVKFCVQICDVSRTESYYGSEWSCAVELKFSRDLTMAVKEMATAAEKLKKINGHDQILLEMLAQKHLVAERTKRELVKSILAGQQVTREMILQGMHKAVRVSVENKIRALPDHVSMLMLPAATSKKKKAGKKKG